MRELIVQRTKISENGADMHDKQWRKGYKKSIKAPLEHNGKMQMTNVYCSNGGSNVNKNQNCQQKASFGHTGTHLEVIIKLSL
jgi:hypothetical protein